MKSYVKPSIEVISMRTSENIADNPIKTLYTKSATSNGSYSLVEGAQNYLESADVTFSNASIQQ